MVNRLLLAILLFATACAPTTASNGTPQVIRIHASPAAQPWLAKAYNCAQELSLALQKVNDPKNADISLRVGEPQTLSTPAYQIDQEDLLVLTHPDSTLQELSQAEVRELFTYPPEGGPQVWVFAADEDIQQAFTRNVLDGQQVTSLARVALSPQQMSSAISEDKNAVGLLPLHQANEGLQVVFSLPRLPVLAIVRVEPQGLTQKMLACLQK